MEHITKQFVKNSNICNLDEALHNLLETLSVMENAVSDLCYDIVEFWTCVEPKIKRWLIERFSYLIQKAMKLSPRWHALCDAHAPTACTSQQILVDKAREAITIIEGGLGWIYFIIYDDSLTPPH